MNKPTITFTQAYRLTDICDLVWGGALIDTWDGLYDGKYPSCRDGVSGSGLNFKRFTLKPVEGLPKNISDALTHNTCLYLLTSARYNIHYVGQTGKAFSKLFEYSGRLSHHARKILASKGGGTNHTTGWRDHAKERYKDFLLDHKVGATLTATQLMGDLVIAFGTSNSDWNAKDHEKVALEYFKSRITEIKGASSCEMNNAKTKGLPAKIVEPNNLESMITSPIKEGSMNRTSKRLVALDTETTGIGQSHRIVEIACIEIIDGKIGRHFQRYTNPSRESSPHAIKVHGLSDQFLANKPSFEAILEDFLMFIGDDPLIAHNASFDMRMINNELHLLGHSPLKNEVICTLEAAKASMREVDIRKSLDSLCDYFEIDRAKRTLHGALIDTELLVELFLTMKAKDLI